MGNEAIQVNNDFVNGIAHHARISVNTHGSDWYYTVCAIMTVSTFAFLFLSSRKARSDRIFHYITAGVTMVAAIAYFCMGSNLGQTSIAVEFHRTDRQVQGNYREIFYVRYIDWFITTPLLLTDLLLTAGMPWPTILFVILVDWVMIVTGLVGALVSSSYKWGFFAFGCTALVYITYMLVWDARVHANAISTNAGRAFLMCGTLTAFLWLLYPIAWGVCEGGNVIGADGEAIFYGILDVLAKPVFGALLIFGHRNISPRELGLNIVDYTGADAAYHEKGLHNGAASNGASNGVTNNAAYTSGASTGATNGAYTTGAATGTNGVHHTTATTTGPTTTTSGPQTTV